MKQLINKIKKSKKVAIFGHQSPDGDCLGSITALSFLCRKLNKEVDAFIDDEIPQRYSFLNFDNINIKEFDEKNYDLLISVDVPSVRTIGKYKDVFLNFNNTIVIDHHSTRDLCGKINYIENTSSCSEILYKLLKDAKIIPDQRCATLLYLGVADDTGCFLHDNTTCNTHKVASELLGYGADFKTINYRIFKLQTRKNFELQKILNENVVFDDGVGYAVISIKFLKDNNCNKDDIGNFINQILNLEGTKIAFVMKEKLPGDYLISFRSLQAYDVSLVAQKFSGGGHKQASGGEIKGKVKDCVQKVLQECKLAIQKGDSDV